LAGIFFFIWTNISSDEKSFFYMHIYTNVLKEKGYMHKS